MELLKSLYFQYTNHLPEAIRPLKGDGSDRQIYRIEYRNQNVIGVIGQNIAENRAFISFSRHFHHHGLPVPAILAVDQTDTAYLETDLGDLTLFDRIQREPGFNRTCLQYYEKVLEWLPAFQITAGADLDYSYCYQTADFGRESMNWDFQYFCDRFLEYFHKPTIDREELTREFEILLEHLLAPKRDFFLYRDFQSRNIMLVNEQPRFIDYQSGRHGALQYDVASLLFDAKAKIPDSVRDHLLQYYIACVQKSYDLNVREFIAGFYPYVWMRIMQALGAYGFLSKVKGKTGFLSNIPPALQNIKSLLNRKTVIDSLPAFKTLFTNLVNDHSLYTVGKR